MIRVKFLKSPTGRFFLGYSEGDIGFVSEEIAEQLLAENYAQLATDTVPENEDLPDIDSVVNKKTPPKPSPRPKKGRANSL